MNHQEVYRMIVKSVMTRMPEDDEFLEDFFIGFDCCRRPYLLLPTPEAIGEDRVFAIRLVGDPSNRFSFELDTNFTCMPFRRFRFFHDDKKYFFGPDDNMLRRFLNSSVYRAYKDWVNHLCEQTHVNDKKQIS